MHIEPGVLAAGKVMIANVAAVGVLGTALVVAWHASSGGAARLLARTLVAALFFTLCMQAFHLKVGPSELHFLGAMPMYLALGAAPTLFGFALGLLAQGLLFEPADLVHLSVNTLSLALPLLSVHAGLGQRIGRVDLAAVLRLDAAYYSGVTLMVGFWLALGELATPWTEWLSFAASYLSVVLLEPVLTIAVLWAIHRAGARPWAQLCFDARRPHLRG